MSMVRNWIAGAYAVEFQDSDLPVTEVAYR